MLDIEGVSVVLGGATVLSGVSARVERGGWLGVIGPNGAGKSTLARAVAGLVPYQGEVRIGGREHGRSDRRSRARSVAYVPQRPIMPRSMSVTDYILLGRSAHHSYLGPRPPATGGWRPRFSNGWSSVPLPNGRSGNCPAGSRSEQSWPVPSSRRHRSWSWTSRPLRSTSAMPSWCWN